MNARDAVLAAVQGRAPTDPVTLPAGWLIEALAAVSAPAGVDMTTRQVAELLGRDEHTVARWCRSGLFPDAYRLFDREWRIPVSALAAFQQHQAAHYRAA